MGGLKPILRTRDLKAGIAESIVPMCCCMVKVQCIFLVSYAWDLIYWIGFLIVGSLRLSCTKTLWRRNAIVRFSMNLSTTPLANAFEARTRFPFRTHAKDVRRARYSCKTSVIWNHSLQHLLALLQNLLKDLLYHLSFPVQLILTDLQHSLFLAELR